MKMSKYFFKHPGLLVTYVIAMLINTAVIVSVALFLQYVLDAVAEADGERLLGAALVGLVYIIVLFMVEWGRRRIAARYIMKTMLRLKSDLFSGIMGIRTADISRTNSAEYISIMNNDLNLVETNYFTTLFTTAQFAMSMVFAVAMLTWLNPFVAMITVILSIAPLSVPKIFGKRLGRLQGHVVEQLGLFTGRVKDFLEGFEVIKTFGVEKNAIHSFDESAKKVEIGKLRLGMANADTNAFANMLSVGVQFAIFLVSGFFVWQGFLTLGAIVAVTQLSGNVIAPLMQITQNWTLLKSIRPVNERIMSAMDSKSQNQKAASIQSLNEGIALRNVSFSYDDTKKCLDDVTYTFRKGGKYAIVGQSGSGKTTLLRTLMGYYDNYSGSFKVGGQEVREINPVSLYQTIAMMHQNVFLFDDSIKNNITLYNKYTTQEFEEAVRKAGLDGTLSVLANGHASEVGESGKTLSGGERQRVAIARAMIKGCEALILDEATANLDNETAYAIEKSLVETPELTCLFVTHRYNKELLTNCDGIIVMRDGKLVESGSFDELYNRKGYFYSLYRIGGEV